MNRLCDDVGFEPRVQGDSLVVKDRHYRPILPTFSKDRGCTQVLSGIEFGCPFSTEFSNLRIEFAPAQNSRTQDKTGSSAELSHGYSHQAARLLRRNGPETLDRVSVPNTFIPDRSERSSV